MTTHYQLTEHDAFALQKDFIRQSRSHRARRLLFTIVLELVAVGYGILVLALLFPESIVLYPLVGGGLIGLVLFPFIKNMYATIAMRQIRYILKGDTKWPRKITLQLDEHGIEVHSIHNTVTKRVHVAWESIQTISEDETNRFLYYEATEAIIIPKRNHGISDVDQTEIERRLRDHLTV